MAYQYSDGQPGYGQSGYGQPGYGQPGYGQPAYGHASHHQPAYPPPQTGYQQGPPPPQQYGGGYSQPPPPNQYPPAPYGAPPPQHFAPPPAQYGQAPHYGPYGAPPGPPPPGQFAAYGAPTGPPTAPSPGYGPPQIIAWDANPDAQALRKAMKGFGTDEKALIRILASKDPLQIEAIKGAYSRMGRSLEKDIRDETSGWFETGLVALVQGPLLHDVHQLYSAMDGPGTKEKILNDVLLSRSNADMHAIKSRFQQTFGKSLESVVKGDLSMKTERHFMIVLGANRAEDSAPVLPQQVDQDVMDLYRATEGKVGTDEILVCSILSLRNDNQIRAIAYTYEQKFRRKLDTVIRKEFSGHMQDALLYQLRHAEDKYLHFATLLEDAMSGLGTKDHLLIRRVVRCHWDPTTLANVKGAYEKKYGKPLGRRIKGGTSGDYERLMLACIGELRL